MRPTAHLQPVRYPLERDRGFRPQSRRQFHLALIPFPPPVRFHFRPAQRLQSPARQPFRPGLADFLPFGTVIKGSHASHIFGIMIIRATIKRIAARLQIGNWTHLKQLLYWTQRKNGK